MENNENKSPAEISPATTCVEKSISDPKANPSNMLILTAEDILKTYPEYEAESARKYYEFLKLKEANPTFGYKKLAKMLALPISATRGWKQWNCKPNPIKAIEKLTQIGLLPLHSDNQKLPAILRLLGAGFTDGGIDWNLNTFHFNSARMENIEAWKKDFLEVFPYGEETLSAIITGYNQSSNGIRTTDRSIVRFFAALGCPVGNKTMISYILPKCASQLSIELKIAFLDGFFSCEVAMPQYPIWRQTRNFVNFSLSMSKIEEKETEHLEFLKTFCELCKSIGIEHTSINRVPQKKIHKDGTQRRKDGKTCDSYRILFSNTSENVMRTYKLIPLTYAIEKKQKFNEAIKTYEQRHRIPINTPREELPELLKLSK
ncbi:MAG: hypothetical protein V1722_04555 [Candidatus Micrarchaeota archaeon]